jgi:hypothetical protein
MIAPPGSKGALRLKWPKCRDGYEILELRRSAVDWPAEADNFRDGGIVSYSGSIPPPVDATPEERRLLAKWRILLAPDPSVPKYPDDIATVIEPRSGRMHAGNVLANAPDLFVEFANIYDPNNWADSVSRLVAFLDNHGPLYDSGPMEVLICLFQVKRFQKVLSQFKIDNEAGSKRWLSSFERDRPRLPFIDSGDVKVVPKIDSGGMHVWLEPPDLLSAIWLQFLLKAADDMTLTHCHSCRNLIAVASSLGRSDKRFCSTACKQRDYRRREAEKKASRSMAIGARRKENRRRSTRGVMSASGGVFGAT